MKSHKAITRKQPITISSWLMLGYVVYIVCIWLAQLIDWCYFWFSWQQQPTVSMILAGILTLLGCWFLWRQKMITCQKLVATKFSLVIVILIIVLTGVRAFFPDNSWDTQQYHLLAQQPGWTNYFQYGFGAGGFQVWGFSLGDKMFYWWQTWLGYRLGTTLNTVAAVIIFSQLEKIILMLLSTKHGKTIAGLWAGAIIASSWELALIFGTYYIDLIGVPLALEAFWLLLGKMQRHWQRAEMIYYALILGLCLAMKLTYIILVAPLALVFCWQARKQLTIKDLVIMAIVGITPVSLYLIFNYYCTGNPIFPYYNTVFRSPYFKLINYKDIRRGGRNLGEKLLWLREAVNRKPTQRVFHFHNPAWLTLLIMIWCWLIMWVDYLIKIWKKKLRDKRSELVSVCFLLMYLCWTLTTGFARYFIGGFLILALSTVSMYKLLNSWRQCLGAAFLIMVLSATAIGIKQQWQEICSGTGWAMHKINAKSIAEQMKMIGHDKRAKDDDSTLPNKILLVGAYQTGAAVVVNPRAEIVVRNYRLNLDNLQVLNIWADKMEEFIEADAYIMLSEDNPDATAPTQLKEKWQKEIEKMRQQDFDLSR